MAKGKGKSTRSLVVGTHNALARFCSISEAIEAAVEAERGHRDAQVRTLSVQQRSALPAPHLPAPHLSAPLLLLSERPHLTNDRIS